MTFIPSDSLLFHLIAISIDELFWFIREVNCRQKSSDLSSRSSSRYKMSSSTLTGLVKVFDFSSSLASAVKNKSEKWKNCLILLDLNKSEFSASRDFLNLFFLARHIECMQFEWFIAFSSNLLRFRSAEDSKDEKWWNRCFI